MSSRPKDEPALQIEEDIGFQVRMHRVQTFCLWVLFFWLIVSLFGLGGGGILSSASVRDQSGRIEAHYDRFARMTARQVLEINLQGDKSAKTIDLIIDGEFVRDVQIESVFPDPDKQSSARQGLRFEIDADPPGAARLIIRYRALRPGMMSGLLQSGGSIVPFQQFVYP